MKIKLIILFLVISKIVFGTGQVPDLIIYKGDTLSLFCNPLEAYYNEKNPRPDYFYVAGCGTACWRNYQAIWEIKDNKLYLNTIQDCCLFYSYMITDSTLNELAKANLPEDLIIELKKLNNKGYYNQKEFQNDIKSKIGKKNYKKFKEVILIKSKTTKKKAPLNLLFKDLVENGKVFAFWFVGDLKIPNGKRLSYVHMGYMSTFEKEIVVEVNKGIIGEINEYDNTKNNIPKDYINFQATSFSFFVPKDLIEPDDDEKSYYSSNDTISIINSDSTKILYAYAYFHPRAEKEKQVEMVGSVIDSIKGKFIGNYRFDEKLFGKTRYGRFCEITGSEIYKKENIKIFAISNINSSLILIYIDRKVNKNSFVETAKKISDTINLVEFGY